MSFPEAYPFEAPIVRFTTPLYHCNVNGLGYICVDILDEQQCWSPGLTVDKLLLSLSALLNDADPLTAYNAEAASQYLRHLYFFRLKQCSINIPSINSFYLKR